MAAVNLTPINRTTGTNLAKAIGPVPAGQEWSVSVRICNSGGVDDSFDLRLRKTDGSVAAYRAKSHPVANGSGTFDIERQLTLTEGFELWDRSAGGNVDASYTGTKRSAV
jgi:hypothetical protein